jgi:hypothetical protein
MNAKNTYTGGLTVFYPISRRQTPRCGAEQQRQHGKSLNNDRCKNKSGFALARPAGEEKEFFYERHKNEGNCPCGNNRACRPAIDKMR